MSRQITGILLAAGIGSRFGSDKLTHRLPQGTPIAMASAASLRSVCEHMVVVVRPTHDALIQPLLDAGYEIVRCADADQGMGASLAAGVQATADAAGWLVALADMPFISPASYRAVISGLESGASLAATQYRGRRGHPVGFSREWFSQLRALTGDHGAKAILEKYRQDLILYPVDDVGVVHDIDRSEDILIRQIEDR